MISGKPDIFYGTNKEFFCNCDKTAEMRFYKSWIALLPTSETSLRVKIKG